MAEKKRVSIKYQYYQLMVFDGTEYSDMQFDLSEWMERMSEFHLEDRTREVNGIEGRLENIELMHADQYYALNFMRLDVISNTYIIKKDEEAKHVGLDENEYIGKNTVLLYDPSKSIVMVQCNRGSYGVGALQSYINSFCNGKNLCYFSPIHDNLKFSDLSKKRTSKLDVRFANTRKFKAKSIFFERILKSLEQTECYTAHIEIGLGYNKGELNNEVIKEVVGDLQAVENRESVSSARIKLDDDLKSSIYDLFENIYYDKIDFIIPARKELSFDTMRQSMFTRYYDGRSRNALYRILEE